MLQSRGLIDFKDVGREQVLDLFRKTREIKRNSGRKENHSDKPLSRIAALVFFEASTRTRMSFEAACVRTGFYPLRLDSKESSSLSKGETPLDTIENIAAMGPDVFIIRAGKELDFQEVARRIPQPILSGGSGTISHPTQALLDAYTLWETNQNLETEKVVIIGDIDHSRVAASHKCLAHIMGYDLKFCGPEQWTGTVTTPTKVTLNEAFEKATALMFLRVQKERHVNLSENDLDQYQREFCLSEKNSNRLRAGQKIMHPGPVNYGVEIDSQTARHSQSLILDQVKNGVYLRQALLESVKDQLQ
ncbi:MAG: aspartate carbamoyltransferase catalytic subunit [Bdellovibrionota bacterium]